METMMGMTVRRYFQWAVFVLLFATMPYSRAASGILYVLNAANGGPNQIFAFTHD